MTAAHRHLIAILRGITPLEVVEACEALVTAGITMIALNGLPQPYHPVFNVERFARASQDGFFLAVETADPRFDADATLRFLVGLNPREVVKVEN